MPCGFVKTHPWKLLKLEMLKTYLSENPPELMISGMAIGWDMWIAWAAIQLDIPFSAYVPFRGQESRWSIDHQRQFHGMLDKAKEVKYICEGGYAPWKMHRRNEAMVADSNRVLAMWNPAKRFGGTYSTVAHCFTVGKELVNFWGETPSKIEVY